MTLWQLGYLVEIGKHTRSPLIILFLYILQDAAGLTDSFALKSLQNSLRQWVLGDDNHDGDVVTDENIGFAAHLGGFLGGLLFYAVERLVRNVFRNNR